MPPAMEDNCCRRNRPPPKRSPCTSRQRAKKQKPTDPLPRYYQLIPRSTPSTRRKTGGRHWRLWDGLRRKILPLPSTQRTWTAKEQLQPRSVAHAALFAVLGSLRKW